MRGGIGYYAALALASAALLAGLLAAVTRQSNPAWAGYQLAYGERIGEDVEIGVRQIVPSLSGEPEFCLTCHIGIEEISPSHPVEVYGCTACHGGVGTALDADLAHSTLRGGRNPSDLAVVSEGCGGDECHSGDPARQRDHIARVERSIQATYAGAIGAVLWTFGQSDGETHFGIAATFDPAPLPDTLTSLSAFDPDSYDHPSIRGFGENCLSCHLSAEPIARRYFYRSTGCAACHVIYADDGLYRGNDPTIPRDEPGHPSAHRMTTAIPYSQCNHCHNRGNYDMRTMEFVERDDLPPPEYYNATERRLADYYQPIGLFTLCEWELDCIDCHTSFEVMGDGHIYAAQADIQYVQCRTCHGTLTEPPATARITDPDDIALGRAFLLGHVELNVGDTVVITERGEAMWHVRQIGDEFVLTMRVTGERLTIPLVMDSDCEQRPDEQESRYCHACHAYER